jgi:hypothetical protein
MQEIDQSVSKGCDRPIHSTIASCHLGDLQNDRGLACKSTSATARHTRALENQDRPAALVRLPYSPVSALVPVSPVSRFSP